MLEHRETKEHPVMIGPMFAHQRKDSNTYYTFASALLGLKSELKNLQCIGTDGETAIASIPSCKHILCFLHQRRNINFKLSELGIVGKFVYQRYIWLSGRYTLHFWTGR